MNGSDMTVGQLIDLLAEYPNETEVRIAHQPQWPFEYHIKGMAFSGGNTAYSPPILWLVEGELIGSLDADVWQIEYATRKR